MDWLGVPSSRCPPRAGDAGSDLADAAGRSLETGVARGGSVIFSASLLSLIGSKVLGVDSHQVAHPSTNHREHPMLRPHHPDRGSSDRPLYSRAGHRRRFPTARASIVVVLDSYHYHDHVLARLAPSRRLSAVWSSFGSTWSFRRDTMLASWRPSRLPQPPPSFPRSCIPAMTVVALRTSCE